MRIEGHFIAEGASRATRAELIVEADQIRLESVEGVLLPPAGTLSVSPRLARIPRRLAWPGFGVFETTDNDGVDVALSARGEAPRPSLIDRLESHWGWVLSALIALPVCLWLLFAFGMPLVARPMAAAIPQSVADELDDVILGWLEEHLIEPTGLPDERIASLRSLEAKVPDDVSIDLNVYGGGPLGANALALPGGTVIFTDELVRLTQSDQELVAILLHETGHVYHQHGLRNLLQTVGVATVLGWVLGDLSAVTDLALVGGPVLLQQLSYSRRFELEADRYARAGLVELGLPQSCLADALARLQDSITGDEKDAAVAADEENAASFSWLSTHPAIEERIATSRVGPPCSALR